MSLSPARVRALRTPKPEVEIDRPMATLWERERTPDRGVVPPDGRYGRFVSNDLFKPGGPDDIGKHQSENRYAMAALKRLNLSATLDCDLL